MKKSILIISAFTNPFLDNNNRVISVASIFQQKGWDVEIVTTNFSHSYKKYYSIQIPDAPTLFKTHFIPVTFYAKNIGFKRIISHLIFAFRVYFYLKKNINLYQLIYTTVPTNFAPFLVNRLALKYGVPHVVDIIDVWPESFYVLTNKFRFILKIITYPWLLISHSVYRKASILISASKKYSEFGKKYRTDDVKAYLLGVDPDKTANLILNSNLELPKKEKGEIWIAYGGSLGNSYDFDVILKALEVLSNENIRYRFIFVGGGVLEKQISEIIKRKNLNAFVTGRLDYPAYLKWLSNCEIAINSFKEGSLVGYSYKFNDYLATGCCVLNNLPGETAELIERFELGLNFDYDKKNLATLLQRLIIEPRKIEYYRNNVHNTTIEELSKDQLFRNLYIDIIEKLEIASLALRLDQNNFN